MGVERGLLVFDEGAQIAYHQWNGILRQMIRLNTHLVVLTTQELFAYNMNTQFTKIPCMANSEITSIHFDEAHLQIFLAQQSDSVLRFELGSTCQIIGKYPVFPGDEVFLAKDLILSQSQAGLNYAINTTDHSIRTYSLPLPHCGGNRSSLSVNRKKLSTYIVSQICITD